MCGLIVLVGKHSHKLISKYTQKLEHRGPDEQSIFTDNNIAIGFQRLAINGDKNEGRQPFEHKKWISLVNGEIYNHRQLAKSYKQAICHCDSKIILPLYLKLKEQVIEQLDGFYAAVLINPAKTQAICLRDFMGKKPLFAGMTDGTLFITSELKSVESISWFKALPKGVSKVDLITGEITLLSKPALKSTPKPTHKTLAKALIASTQNRLPHKNQPLALFLSGGLDSSIIASIVSKLRKDIVYLTLGNNAKDLAAAKTVAKHLKLNNLINVKLPSSDELPHLINKIVHTTESYNPSIISNGLATYLLSKAANKLGIKVVLTGEGADELFGGYHYFEEHQPWQQTRKQLINDMTFTELRRLDLACMANAIEPRCPFLDKTVIALSDQMTYDQLYNKSLNKVILRNAFKNELPPEILLRKKVSCDVGSGIRSMVVNYLKRNGHSEREELLKIWKQYFTFDSHRSYFHSYPAFDAVIDIRGAEHK